MQNEIEYYLENTFDAIEYAIGDSTSEWGSKRATAGHPEPFPLKYVEIGNENRGPVYDERFNIFYSAIKEKYPQLTLISNHGITGTGTIKQTDMVDPHYYVAPDFFFTNTTIFDNLERGKYTVYVGEYAVNNDVGAGNMLAALSEAAFITGMERNGDLVTMTSYTPLLENRNNRCWAVNLIWLDTDQVVGRSSYYVQKMAADHKPNYNLGMNKTLTEAKPASIPAGSVGVGTWVTHAEFKDFKVTQAGKTVDLDMNNVATKRGEWTVSDSILSQTSMNQSTRLIFGGFEGNDYTLEFKGRKIEGKEGFFVYFGNRNSNQDGYAFNLGGWDNTTSAVQNVVNGSTSSQLGTSVAQSLEAGKWYNVKVEVNSDKAELFVDNELILTYQHTTTPLQFFASGYDENTGELIVKVVNADSTSYNTQLVLEGASKIEKTGKIISLVAQSGFDENSFEEPKKIYPVETEFIGFGKNFNYEFPPYSFTILRVKANSIKN
jgi:alpha-L-arabinofuranosidase